MNSSQKAPRILVVDDHRDTVELTAFFLIKRGYSVARAHSAAEARLEAARQKFDLMVSDIRLTDGDGIGLMNEFQKTYGMKGVLVSGSIKDGEARDSVGIKFLSKPVELEKLFEAIRALTLSGK
ncbi:MAG TPA: response regulator [Tepidisphaeraceae bacterium]|nr:response regulator [Tepidisphaeraceae bacterium]